MSPPRASTQASRRCSPWLEPLGHEVAHDKEAAASRDGQPHRGPPTISTLSARSRRATCTACRPTGKRFDQRAATSPTALGKSQHLASADPHVLRANRPKPIHRAAARAGHARCAGFQSTYGSRHAPSGQAPHAVRGGGDFARELVSPSWRHAAELACRHRARRPRSEPRIPQVVARRIRSAGPALARERLEPPAADPPPQTPSLS